MKLRQMKPQSTIPATTLIINLEFKTTGEENNTLSYLDLSINRNSNHIELGIYRKPTHMDINIHRSSKHPCDHKLAAFKYYISRMVILPITEQAAIQEWEEIIAMAHNNGFPEQTVQKLRKKLRNKRDRPMRTQQPQQCKKKGGSILHTMAPRYKK